MQYIELVQTLESGDDLDDDLPNVLLLVILLVVLVLADALEDIAIVSVLHDDAERVAAFVEECLFVCSDEWIFDGSENADFV